MAQPQRSGVGASKRKFSERKQGRSLMLVTRDGASLGAVLVREGLAEQWGGVRRAWC
ncbi:hypothetical protein [Porphyrobacter sp. AAP60]|uniref:hypothetical protein n=1 Tax=Porphyrobacter sp. AAP60 TaxID=1523423 RepID=UPI000B056796|nr:hypothetical protein [Porphyrobacter sp. AAP60]